MMTLNDISATALLALGWHAMDAKSKHPILNNQSAIATVRSLAEQTGVKVQQKKKGELVTKSLLWRYRLKYATK